MPSKPRTRRMYNQLDLTLYPYLPSPSFIYLVSKLFGQCPSTVQTFFNSLDTLHSYSPNGLTLLCPKCPKNPPTVPLYIRTRKSVNYYYTYILFRYYGQFGQTSLKPLVLLV